MKVFTLSMVLGLAMAGSVLAQGSTLTSGYTKVSLKSSASAPKATAAPANKTNAKFTEIKADAKPATYVYKAPMATRPLKTW